MGRTQRAVVMTLVLAGSVGCDQATKVAARAALEGNPGRSFLQDTVRLTFARNEGAFLSLGANLPPTLRFGLLTVGVGVLLLVGLWLAFRARTLALGYVVASALLFAGGLSNWVDRLRGDGAVVDFLNLGFGPTLRTGIFNVADLSIVAGAALLALAGSRKHSRIRASH